MKWTRAVHHLELMALACADMATRPGSIFPLRVRQLWAAREILEPGRPDLEAVTVALCVDLPVEDVPWWGEPPGAQHWANATRLAQNPLLAWWRSAHAPVWNHYLVRPALIWDVDDGVREDALTALRDGRGESVRIAAPAPEAYVERMERELAVSMRALRAATRNYDERRWRPGKLEPVADALWRASEGYLDVLDALDGATDGTTGVKPAARPEADPPR
jgi:hypothetical protein